MSAVIHQGGAARSTSSKAMTDKITIERETLERQRFEAWMSDDGKWPKSVERDGNGNYRLASAANNWRVWRAALAAQPATVDDHLKCGHHRSLAINSAETGEFLYCDLCDAKSRCRDAETMEEELRAALAAQPAIGVTCTMTDAPCTRNCGLACSLQMEALAAQAQPARLSDSDIARHWFATTEEDEIWPSVVKFAHAIAAAVVPQGFVVVKDEPVAWEVYNHEANNGYLVDSLDDMQLVEDMTNCEGVEATPLYAKATK